MVFNSSNGLVNKLSRLDLFKAACSLSIFLYLSMTTVIKGGFAYGIIVLWILGCYSFFSPKTRKLSGPNAFLAGAFLLYFLSATIISLYHSDLLREYDLPIRFLLAIPVIYALRGLKINADFFWYGLTLGTILGFILVSYLRYHISSTGDHVRIEHLGNISMIMGWMCLSGWRWAADKNSNVLPLLILVIVAWVCGVMGSILSATRGAWLMLPLGLLILSYDACRYVGWSGFRSLLVIIFTVTIATFLAFEIPMVKERADRAVLDFGTIYHDGSYKGERIEDTSIGQRWLMWSNVAHMVPMKPLLGWGKRGYLEYKNYRILIGDVPAQISRYTDAHNDYLDAQVKRGFIGLLSLMSLYFVPLFFYARSFGLTSYNNIKALSLAGVMMAIGYMVSGLTCTFMTINMDVMFYSITNVVIFSLISRTDIKA